MTLRLDICDSVNNLESLRQDWSELLSEYSRSTPFATLEWHQANLTSFVNQSMQVLSFRDSASRPVAILPLVWRQRRKYFRRMSWLEFAGLPYADYGSCLVKNGCAPQVVDAFLDYLISNRTWRGVYLDGLRSDDEFVDCLVKAARRRKLFALVERTHRIRLLTSSANSQPPLQASRSLAKARRKIACLGDVSFNVYTSTPEILPHLDDYFQMHIERCAAKGAASPLADSAQQNLFRNVVRCCAPQGIVWLSSLFCGRRCIASRFSLRYGDVLHLYSTCFATDYARYSPSMLQLNLLLDYAFRNGIQTIDFGMGDSPQKERAGAAVTRQLSRIELYRVPAAYWESRAYLAARRRASRSPSFARSAQLARKLFPHQL